MAIELIESTYGRPSSCRPSSAGMVEKYAERLPGPLLATWAEQGWCAYGGGLLWLTDPDAFQEVADLWAPDAASAPCFARTAFGDLFLWDGQGVIFIDVIEGERWNFQGPWEEFVKFVTEPVWKMSALRVDIFEEARALVGPPNHDELYAFEPAVCLGGPGTADTIQRRNLFAHLHFLRECQD
jgi:hypothetical protein